jgi:hypothetical protein
MPWGYSERRRERKLLISCTSMKRGGVIHRARKNKVVPKS